jgi:hypothetical protein
MGFEEGTLGTKGKHAINSATPSFFQLIFFNGQDSTMIY